MTTYVHSLLKRELDEGELEQLVQQSISWYIHHIALNHNMVIGKNHICFKLFISQNSDEQDESSNITAEFYLKSSRPEAYDRKHIIAKFEKNSEATSSLKKYALFKNYPIIREPTQTEWIDL